MNTNAIKEFYQAAPFQPFEIVLPNGSTIPIDHPEFMAFSRDYRTVIVSKLYGGATLIDVKLIVALNLLSPNSKRKKK